VSFLPATKLITRRRFLTAGACFAAGATIYSGEIERHWIEISRRDVTIPGLQAAFDGFRIAQLSDIHLDEFTEPYFLRDAIARINGMNPDAVFLTGDFITRSPVTRRIFKSAEWQCAGLLNHLQCLQRYACLGNHDFLVGRKKVTEALTYNGIKVLNNDYLPIERGGGRFWLSGVEDPLEGHPDPDAAIPASIRNLPGEPVVLLCHGPDYVDNLLALPAGSSVSLMLSGHTHGGQIRLPLIGPLSLPPYGKKYVQGWFGFGSLQLHVNRGIGTVGLPLRFDCPPEITLITLRTAASRG
jgi:predicted MPP superfamily phosphohydrolase